MRERLPFYKHIHAKWHATTPPSPLSLCLSLSTREWLTLLLFRLARSGWCLDLLAVLALLLGQVRVCIVVAQARAVLVALPTDWHTHTRSQKNVIVMAAHSYYRAKRPKMEPQKCAVQYAITRQPASFKKNVICTRFIFGWRASSKLIHWKWAFAQWAMASRKLQSTHEAAKKKK